MDLDGEEADSEAKDGGEVSMSESARASADASASETAAWSSVRRMARVWADRGMGLQGRCGCCGGAGALLEVRVESDVGVVDADVEAKVEEEV